MKKLDKKVLPFLLLTIVLIVIISFVTFLCATYIPGTLGGHGTAVRESPTVKEATAAAATPSVVKLNVTAIKAPLSEAAVLNSKESLIDEYAGGGLPRVFPLFSFSSPSKPAPFKAAEVPWILLGGKIYNRYELYKGLNPQEKCDAQIANLTAYYLHSLNLKRAMKKFLKVITITRTESRILITFNKKYSDILDVRNWLNVERTRLALFIQSNLVMEKAEKHLLKISVMGGKKLRFEIPKNNNENKRTCSEVAARQRLDVDEKVVRVTTFRMFRTPDDLRLQVPCDNCNPVKVNAPSDAECFMENPSSTVFISSPSAALSYNEMQILRQRTSYLPFYAAIMRGDIAAVDSEASKLRFIISEVEITHAIKFAILRNEVETLKHLFFHTFPVVLKGAVYFCDLGDPLNVAHQSEIDDDTEYEYSFQDYDEAMHAEQIIPFSVELENIEIFKMAVEDWKLPIDPKAVNVASSFGLKEFIEIMLRNDHHLTAAYLSVTDEDLNIVAMVIEKWRPVDWNVEAEVVKRYSENYPVNLEEERRKIFDRVLEFHGERFARCANHAVNMINPKLYPVLCQFLKENNLLKEKNLY